MAIEVINGSDLYVFIDATVVAHATSHSLSMKMNTRDTSNKDTGKFNTKAVGRMDVSATADALMVYTDVETLMAAYLARTPVHVAFGERTGAVLADGEYSGGALDATKFYADGNFIITGLDMNAGDQENASYSVSFENSDATFTYSGDGTLRVYIVKTNPTVALASTGMAVAIASGGTAPYTYLWDNADATQAAEGLPAGDYEVTVTDAVAATATASCTLIDP